MDRTRDASKRRFEMKEPAPEAESPFLDEAAYDLPTREEAWATYEAEPELQLETPFASAFAPEAPPIPEEEKGIIGGNRERVRDTLAVPFRWICRIWVQRRVKTPGHEEKKGLAPAGTGLLISPHHVLTCAHLLLGQEKRGSVVEEHEALHVEVAPAAHGDSNPFGRFEASSWDLPPGWKPGSQYSPWDFAIITLKEAVGDRTLKKWKGGSLCFWGSPKCGAGTSVDTVPSALAKKIIGARILTAGYPTAKKGEMWCAAGKFSFGATNDALLPKQGIVEDGLKKLTAFYVTADASEGQSGSPVWIVGNGNRYLLGIMVSIGDKANTALNLRTDVVLQIQSWTGQATAGGGKTEKLFEEPEWLEESSEDMDGSGEEVFESPSAFTIVGRSLAEPEEYVQAVDSPQATAEEAEYNSGRWSVAEEVAEDEFDVGPGATALEEHQLPAPKDTELRHFHVKKTLNVAGSLAVAAKTSLMKPLEMMPAYIDPWLDTLDTDPSPTGLQGLLSELMLGRWSNFLSPESVMEKKARPSDRLYVALIDLTGAKLSKPEFAGWAPTEAVDGASVPKILALYALFQLRFDLNHLASTNAIAKKADLLKRAENHWKSTGLAGQPSLDQLFNFVEEAGKPVQVRFQSWLDAASFNINGNCSVTRLMNRLGFDYIGSVALQSGLRHPARGGLWLGTTYMCNGQHTRWKRDPVPLIAGCVAGSQSGHHITALSAATYYTLLAQGRLVDEPSSNELMTRLKRGCRLSPGGFRNGLEALGGVTLTAQKCGLLGKCKHESFFVERDRFRYVAIALFRGAGLPFNLLIQDLDEIIRKRNP